MRRQSTRLVLTVALGLVLSGCRFSGVAFIQDLRLQFTSPEERGLVALPTTITWEIEDFDISEPGSDVGDGYFGVFVDARPQPPGQPLSWFAKDDDDCARQEDCPDEEYYTRRGINTTTDTEFTIDFLNQPSDEGRREFHELTVILLDAQSRRIGESAWTIDFEVDRGEGG